MKRLAFFKHLRTLGIEERNAISMAEQAAIVDRIKYRSKSEAILKFGT